jgi:N6-adenosine-specific RNA methylase IME4
MKPVCPWCRKKAVVFYTRINGSFQGAGYYCPNCGKIVDPVVRKPPVVFRMQVEEFLNQHNKKYSVILTDPPYHYNKPSIPHNRMPEQHYTTMTTDDICNLPISNIANDRSALFMWSPSSKLTDAFRIAKAWGFDDQHSTEIIWMKTAQNGQVRMGLGKNVRNTHEHLLMFKKGDFPMPKIAFPNAFFALQTDNSRKPQRAYEIMENMYPDASRIEIFARYVHPGWVGVGNQAEPLPENVYIPKGKMYTNSQKKSIQNSDSQFEIGVV